jgi:uncharacterized RmlC-like cupin family protein
MIADELDQASMDLGAVMKAIASLILLSTVSALAQQAAPIPAEEVTLRKQIYEDARVRVFLLDIPPGHATVLHRHDRDMLSVFVSGGKTRAVFDGRPPVDDTFAVGDVRFRTAGFTHSTENRDSANFLSVIFEFVQPQGARMAPTRPAIRTCAVGDDSACVNEQPRFCTTGFCVDEVTMAPGAVTAEAAPTTDRILVPLSAYSLVKQTAGGTPIVHHKKRGEVELIPAGPPRRWTNPTKAPAHYIVLVFR